MKLYLVITGEPDKVAGLSESFGTEIQASESRSTIGDSSFEMPLESETISELSNFHASN